MTTPRPAAAATGAALVIDDLTGRLVFVAENRVSRPSPTAADCPFCPGGRESPGELGPYAFANRWPPVEQGRCDVIVYGHDHHRDLAALSPPEIATVIDVWADRGRAQWRRPGTRCVLVFENRGPEAGATVPHPHSQLFGLPFVPPFARPSPPGTLGVVDSTGIPGTPSGCPACASLDPRLLIEAAGGWAVTVPSAPPAPYCLRLIPSRHVDTLDRLDQAERDGLSVALGRAVQRLDRLFSLPMPYHLWICQVRTGHLTVIVCGLLRGPERLRILGAAEMATGLLFTPLAPHRAATELRAALPAPS